MDSLQEIEQKTKHFAKSAFTNLSFLITLFKAHERRCVLAVVQDRNSQYLSEWRIGMGCATIIWYSHDSKLSPLPTPTPPPSPSPLPFE